MPKLFDLRSAFRRRFSRKSPIDKQVEALSSGAEVALDAAGKARPSQVAPAIILATGAGVALWWWTQWAHGSAESETTVQDRGADDGAAN